MKLSEQVMAVKHFPALSLQQLGTPKPELQPGVPWAIDDRQRIDLLAENCNLQRAEQILGHVNCNYIPQDRKPSTPSVHTYKGWQCGSKLTPAPYEKAQTSEEMIYMQAGNVAPTHKRV